MTFPSSLVMLDYPNRVTQYLHPASWHLLLQLSSEYILALQSLLKRLTSQRSCRLSRSR